MLSKFESVSTKLDYVAGQVTDKNGEVWEHGFLHTKKDGKDVYYDPTLDRDKDRKHFRYESFQMFSSAELERLVIRQKGKEQYEKMANGEIAWCQPRLQGESLVFEYASD